jgi:hypothetical protein
MIAPLVLTHPSVERWVKTLFYTVTAGYEDYLLTGLAIRPPPPPTTSIADGTPPYDYRPRASPEWAKKYFIRGDIGTGEIIQLTLTTVSTVLARDWEPWEHEMLKSNIGQPQWCVAAMLLGLNSLPDALLRWMLSSGMHKCTLSYWATSYSDWLAAVRICPRLLGIEHLHPADIFMLRKILNCTVRTKKQADFAAEKQRRTNDIPAHFAMDAEGRWEPGLWEKITTKLMRELAHEVVSNAAGSVPFDSMKEWWMARWAWAPSGSTTNREATANIKAQDERLHSNARPGKKAAFEELPDDYPMQEVEYAPLQLARGSTKPEPGGKQRSLFAVNDEHFVVAAYGSVHLEKFMNVWGIKAKQMPVDVADWLAADKFRPVGGVWMSLDYSDYNTEHEAQTLFTMDMALAEAWESAPLPPEVREDKAKSARWTAEAHINAWVADPMNPLYRTFGTLFSGDRNTARDNSLLHGVYSRAVVEFMKPACSDIKPVWQAFTGDDEDSVLPSWIAALAYYTGHVQAGFVFKPAKQMNGAATHEFLQRNVVPNKGTVRPMFAMLAQLASGNWYQDVHIWYDAAVSAISDNIWELHIRGMPLLTCRRLAVEVINATMRVPQGELGWKRLEWWKYRNGEKEHPLWAGLPGDTEPPPKIEAKTLPHPSARHLATNCWLQLKMRQGIVMRDEQWKQYAEHCMKESYSKLYTATRASNHKEFARTRWPERSSTIPMSSMHLRAITPPNYDSIHRLLGCVGADRRPATLDDVLANMQLDSKLVELAGGLDKVIRMLKPHIMKFYTNPLSRPPLRTSMYYLDPALRSWLTAASVPEAVERYPRPKRALRIDSPDTCTIDSDDGLPWIDIYLAPNCAGKSTFAASHPGIADTDSTVAAERLKTQSRLCTIFSPFVVPESPLLTLIPTAMTAGATAFTSQYRLSDILRPPNQRDFHVKVTIVNPPPEILIPRMQARGWDQTKINKRLTRWTNTLRASMVAAQTLLNNKELKLVSLREEF